MLPVLAAERARCSAHSGGRVTTRGRESVCSTKSKRTTSLHGRGVIPLAVCPSSSDSRTHRGNVGGCGRGKASKETRTHTRHRTLPGVSLRALISRGPVVKQVSNQTGGARRAVWTNGDGGEGRRGGRQTYAAWGGVVVSCPEMLCQEWPSREMRASSRFPKGETGWLAGWLAGGRVVGACACVCCCLGWLLPQRGAGDGSCAAAELTD